MMLEVRDLHAYYGKSHILQGVDITIDAGEVVSLLGRNGVGRSTTVKAIMGEVPPQGTILFKGSNIAGLPSYKIAHLGLGYVPEHRDIFPGLTVRQNLMLGIKDPRKVYLIEDMVKGDCLFAATGVTTGSFLRGVKFGKDVIETETVVMRSVTGTVRYIRAEHRQLDKFHLD